MPARTAVRLVLALALSASVAPAMALASTGYAATSVASLAQGPAPHTAYLSDGVIHRANGDRIRVRVRRSARPHLQLLGHTPAGWAVVRWGDVLLMVTARGTHRVARMPDWGPFSNRWYLSRDRSRVLVAADEDQAGLRLSVLGLDGKVQQDRMFRNYPSMLDFTGSRVLLANDRATYAWVPGHRIAKLNARPSTFARWDDDLLFVGTSASGPTSLHHPGSPSWTTTMTPMDVSPDGRRVVALEDQYTGGVQRYAVLARWTGKMLASWRLPHTMGTVLRWESNRAVLIGIDGKRGQTVLRCRVTGSCTRALPWSARAAHAQAQFPISVSLDYGQGQL